MEGEEGVVEDNEGPVTVWSPVFAMEPAAAGSRQGEGAVVLLNGCGRQGEDVARGSSGVRVVVRRAAAARSPALHFATVVLLWLSSRW
jgi:hypothetical protein